ncbi:MAG: DUF6125 family protein [Acetobacteraceae bacterium]|nr:DUF6125 family protein [Acetobacteraceae bacterium]
MGILDLDHASLQRFVADAARRWLAHDGLWFQAVERAYGLDAAVALDIEAWREFAPLEARRILSFLGLAPGGGLDALEQALPFRLYALINRQEILRPSPGVLVFRMNSCRVQEARRRKGLAEFACRPVGLVEYEGFAQAIDPRIQVRCLGCPPDPHPTEWFCAWEFTLSGCTEVRA